jgi:peptide chain release factor 3
MTTAGISFLLRAATSSTPTLSGSSSTRPDPLSLDPLSLDPPPLAAYKPGIGGQGHFARPKISEHPMTDAQRRTFAIISHPDAGKTTLTEKLLLAGGAIRMAGAVKAQGEKRRARSDWMKIEQDRGISVTSSVMTFEHEGLMYNLLDTPGHEDFSEDTYRTLTAVDSAIMVIDAAKGIESQTLKLFEVCRLRDIPIMVLVNKIDREGLDPFALLDELQDKLALDVAPLVWPMGMGTIFQGAYDMAENLYHAPEDGPGSAFGDYLDCNGIADNKLDDLVSASTLAKAREEMELAQAGYPEFDAGAYRAGHLAPVVFGSALKGYGVGKLIDLIGAHAPGPRPRRTETREVEPDEDKVSGFVFKVQANMDRKHRDRVAFMRLCSGTFKRGMRLHQVRTAKDIMVSSPLLFLAQDREIAEHALPGDVIGIPNHGTVRVGDTLTEGEEIRFTGLPAFAPEILRRVRMPDTTRIKQLRAALEDLAEEGLIQVFKPTMGANWIVGVIGTLQLDVLTDRAKQEYRIDIGFEAIPYETARWLSADDKDKLDAFLKAQAAQIVTDRDGAPVFLARNQWDLDYAAEKNPDIQFAKTRELV